jgi:hypothetical protein
MGAETETGPELTSGLRCLVRSWAISEGAAVVTIWFSVMGTISLSDWTSEAGPVLAANRLSWVLPEIVVVVPDALCFSPALPWWCSGPSPVARRIIACKYSSLMLLLRAFVSDVPATFSMEERGVRSPPRALLEVSVTSSTVSTRLRLVKLLRFELKLYWMGDRPGGLCSASRVRL